jgi:hypothetical protein
MVGSGVGRKPGYFTTEPRVAVQLGWRERGAGEGRRPEVPVVRAGMKQDWSWGRSAAEYEHLDERLLARGR